MKKNERRIENKTSRTAEFNCMIRAASFYEKRPQYKSNDYIAPKLLPKFFLPVARIGFFRNLFWSRVFPPGMYEYVIARTKFIDNIYKNAISNEFDQILLFGAGFDTRSIRLANSSKKTSIFELDAPVTQKSKINQFKNKGVQINPNTTFISMDFNRESIEDKLLDSDFNKNKRTLFILEGLLFYLQSQAVDDTFKVINQFSGEESEVVFDYIFSSVLRGENLYYGESEVFNGVKNENEPWSFGIEKGEIESFLENKNLKLIKNLNSEDLEREFFEDEMGNIIAKVNGTHGIAYAKIDYNNK